MNRPMFTLRLVVLALLCASRPAMASAILDIGFEPSAGRPGSFFSGFDVLCCNRELGYIFDVSQPFEISSFGLGFGVSGTMSFDVRIYKTSLSPANSPQVADRSLAAMSSATVAGVDAFFFSNFCDSVGGDCDGHYFDVPISFSFEAGQRYEVVVSTFSLVDAIPVQVNNWALVEGASVPYAVGDVLTVVSGSLRPGRGQTPNEPNFTVPWARFTTDSIPVPEPTSFVLLCTGLFVVRRWQNGHSRHSRRP